MSGMESRVPLVGIRSRIDLEPIHDGRWRNEFGS